MSEVGRPSAVVVVAAGTVVEVEEVVDVIGSVVEVVVESAVSETEHAVSISPSATNLAVVRIQKA